MDGFTLTVIDSSSIQSYIFGSNKLKENIGASHLLLQVSRSWLYEALQVTAKDAHNFGSDATITNRALEDDANQQLEVIYSGGGNIMLLSRSEKLAKDVVRTLSRILLERAPGLEISAMHRVINASDTIGGSTGVYNQLLLELNRAKQQRHFSIPQLGLGVTMECRATGLPAVYFDKEEQRCISAEIRAKLHAVSSANERLKQDFGDIYKKYAFATDFDNFGRSPNESSYIAVVHADGNAMGQRFEKLIAQFGDSSQNRACSNALRDLSNAVETSARDALLDTLQQLNKSFSTHGQTELDERMRRFATGLQSDGSAKPYFPVRPLIFGGDDLTLVCDGRLGLALAAVYLKAFHSHTTSEFARLDFQDIDKNISEELKKPAYACAGVAIVKTHYPFARAYHLSSALCDGVKDELRRLNYGDASAMDWHFAATGINASLGEMRQRQYTVKNGKLTMRPITVAGKGLKEPWRDWDTLRMLIETFVNDEEWRERHNKVVALREALRDGDVEHFLRNYKVSKLPALHGGDSTHRTSGWQGDRSGYFDAIEALDFYLPVEPVQVKELES